MEAHERQVAGRCRSRPRCLGLGCYVDTAACAWSVSPAYIGYLLTIGLGRSHLLANLQKYHPARLRRRLATGLIFRTRVLRPVLQINMALV